MGRSDEGRGEAVKYVHEGREFDVAELAKLIRGHAFEARLEGAHDYAEKMLAAAALLARHERERDVFTTALAWFRADCGMSGPEWNAFLTACDRTALRGEEDPRG